MNLIKVSGDSRTSAVAIAGVVREHHRAEVQATGAGAVNQAMKALILVTDYLKLNGIYICCMPEFVDVTIDDQVRTAIKLVIEPQNAADLPAKWIRRVAPAANSQIPADTEAVG